MPCTRLLARRYYSSNHDSKKTPIIVGIVILVLFCGVVMLTLRRCSMRDKSRPSHQGSGLARAQLQRRENDGWWGAEPSRVETAAERRRRNIQVRANRTAQNEIESEARREVAREGEDALPKYQRPAPAYYSNPEWRRQHLTGRRELIHPPPPQQNDAPPAYDSPAVWPTGVRGP